MHIKGQLRTLAQEQYENSKISLEENMQREMAPYTQNHYFFEIIEKKSLNRVKRNCIAAAQLGLQPLAMTARIQSIFSQVRRLSMQERQLNELAVILDAYGKVAGKRIIDDVPMIARAMFEGFLKKFRQEMKALDSELSSLMSESADVVANRRFLKKKVEALSLAEKAVRDFNLGIV
jgi:hypothetical protein